MNQCLISFRTEGIENVWQLFLVGQSVAMGQMGRRYQPAALEFLINTDD